jgi:hypothetical protein
MKFIHSMPSGNTTWLHKETKHIMINFTSHTVMGCKIYYQMDYPGYRQNFDLDKKNEVHYHSWKEHLKMSKIATFGCELL